MNGYLFGIRGGLDTERREAGFAFHMLWQKYGTAPMTTGSLQYAGIKDPPLEKVEQSLNMILTYRNLHLCYNHTEDNLFQSVCQELSLKAGLLRIINLHTNVAPRRQTISLFIRKSKNKLFLMGAARYQSPIKFNVDLGPRLFKTNDVIS